MPLPETTKGAWQPSQDRAPVRRMTSPSRTPKGRRGARSSGSAITGRSEGCISGDGDALRQRRQVLLAPDLVDGEEAGREPGLVRGVTPGGVGGEQGVGQELGV